MINVNEIIEPNKIGRTHPFTVLCDDGHEYIIKMKNEFTYTHKVEFNELIAYRLAKLMDLSIPTAKIVFLPQSIINSDANLSNIHAVPGPCFASEFHKGTTTLTRNIFDVAKNLNEIPGMFLFDEIILNDDRWSNWGNLFYDLSSSKILLIDHSDIFKNGQVWTSYELKSYQCLPPVTVTLDGPNYDIAKDYVKGKSPFESIEKLVNGLSDNQIDSLFKNIPPEWIKSSEDVSTEDVVECKNFVTFQLKNCSSILKEIHNYFPSWEGGN